MADEKVAEEKVVETETTQTESPQVESPITGDETIQEEAVVQTPVEEESNVPAMTEEQRRAFQETPLCPEVFLLLTFIFFALPKLSASRRFSIRLSEGVLLMWSRLMLGKHPYT